MSEVPFVNVQLRYSSGEPLNTRQFPSDATLSEVAAEYGDRRLIRLSIIPGRNFLQEAGRWEVFECTDVDGGKNAAQRAVSNDSDVEECRRQCEAAGFGGFVIWRGQAFFRAAAGSDLKQRAAIGQNAEATFHLLLNPVEVMQELTLSQLMDGSNSDLLSLTLMVAELHPVRLSLTEIAALEGKHTNVTDLEVRLEKADTSLHCLVERFPMLQKLVVKIPEKTKAGEPAKFWDDLGLLSCLEHLHIANHHNHPYEGALGNEVFRSMLSWGSTGPKLRKFALTGAMALNFQQYKEFIDNNEVLSDDLEEFSVFYWYANPAQLDNDIFQKITKRYQRLKVLEVGSCVGNLTDAAFKYFTDNNEGVNAGHHLEKLFLVCITDVDGVGWLESASVKRCLPNLKEFKIGGGRVFCQCGGRGCGSQAHIIDQLKSECGVKFIQDAPHW